LSSNNPPKHQYNGIQVLRFVAASMVTIYHSFIYYDNLSGTPIQFHDYFDPGLLSRGVAIFFVISGFIMAMSAERLSIGKFLWHRALRIYFGYIAAIVIAVAAKTAVFGSYPMQLISFKSVSLLPFGEIGYPLGVEWSLVYEIAFYAVIALLIALRYPAVRIGVMLAWMVVIMAFGGESTHLLPNASQILLSQYNLGFIAGYFCWHLKGMGVGRFRDFFILGIVLLLGDLIITWPLMRELFVVAGASLIVLGASDPQFSERFAADHPLVRWGNASYGLYLMHVTILGCVYAGSGQHGLGIYLTGLLMALAGGIFFGSCEFTLYQRLKRLIDARRNLVTTPAVADKKPVTF